MAAHCWAMSKLTIYHRLNQLTMPDPLPMLIFWIDWDKPHIFQHLTLEVPVHKESIPKTVFIATTEKYEFLVMPFGLMGTPSIFQKFMNSNLADMSEYIVAYIDDVVVFSNSLEDYIEHLDKFLGRLNSLGLTVKPTKCQLTCKEWVIE